MIHLIIYVVGIYELKTNDVVSVTERPFCFPGTNTTFKYVPLNQPALRTYRDGFSGFGESSGLSSTA